MTKENIVADFHKSTNCIYQNISQASRGTHANTRNRTTHHRPRKPQPSSVPESAESTI